jgi:hypothetical protein
MEPRFRDRLEPPTGRAAALRPRDRRWALYCADRNGRWHNYPDTKPTRQIDELLTEVDADPTGIFWG